LRSQKNGTQPFACILARVSVQRSRNRSLYLQAARSPYPELANLGRSYVANLPAPAESRRTPSATSKDSDAILGGIILAVGAIALVELLSNPSSSGSSSGGGGGGRAAGQDDGSGQVIRDHIASENARRDEAAAHRQAERDLFYRTQRCGFNARSNCF
jgi:hypothetical protein